MPLPNRVTPEGELVADPARGLFMGNRGGRLHDPETRALGRRRHVSKRWITCALEFGGRRRTVWGDGYTELFFLDEVTAFAAGHRPCFECRRAEAVAFLDAALGKTGGKVGPLDETLHAQRLEGRRQRRHEADASGLPDGAVVLHGGRPHGLLGGNLLPWRADGWGPAVAAPAGPVVVLTPEIVLDAFRRGYRPLWHASAGGS